MSCCWVEKLNQKEGNKKRNETNKTKWSETIEMPQFGEPWTRSSSSGGETVKEKEQKLASHFPLQLKK